MTEAEAHRLGREVLAKQVDVSDRAQMQDSAVHQQVAAVDLLVDNAGVGLGGSFSRRLWRTGIGSCRST